MHLGMLVGRVWRWHGTNWSGLGHLLDRWRHVPGLVIVGPIPLAVFALAGGFPIEIEALLHDLEAHGAAYLKERGLLRVALAGFALGVTVRYPWGESYRNCWFCPEGSRFVNPWG